LAELQVSHAEFAALEYVKGAVAAAVQMQERWNSDNSDLLMSEGSYMHRRVDWRRVQQECAPHVLVVLAHDGTRDSEKFSEFPIYALIPRLGSFVHLQDDVTLSIEEGSVVRREQVVSALNLLRLSTSSIDVAKKDNARKMLSGLHKLLLG